MSAQKQVQFLPGDELSKTPTGKTVKWGLRFARHLIVFTELILIIAFLSRFRLDQNLSELQQQIKASQAVISNFEELENSARFLHQRLITIEAIDKSIINKNLILEELTQIIPIEVTFQELNIQKSEISFSGQSLSNVGLITLLNKLEESSTFTNVDLQSVSSPGLQDPTLSFSIKANITSKKQSE